MKRLALITGGTRGLGAALSQTFHQEGYRVIATYNQNEEAAQTFQKKTGIEVMQWDVKNFAACQENVEKIHQSHGPIEILINNAGITRDGFLHKMTEEAWEDVIATNLNSCFYMTRSVLGSMREREFGRIINISSINGQKGQIGQTNYCAAKAGIIGFTKALALEVATKGITVNAIAPGYMDTEMVKAIRLEILEKIVAQVPLQRLGTGQDVAQTALFLANDSTSYITGAVLNVNGGMR